MRCCVVFVLLLQCLVVSGLPLFELSSKADRALRMALDEINTRYARIRLYKVSKASVKKVVPLGMNVYDMILKFGIRETECLKSSGSEPQTCPYRWSFMRMEDGCSVRVRVTDQRTDIVALNCDSSGSSSSESSEEMGTGWHYDPNRLIPRDPPPATSTPDYDFNPAPLLPRRPSGHGDIRGDNFSNHLE